MELKHDNLKSSFTLFTGKAKHGDIAIIWSKLTNTNFWGAVSLQNPYVPTDLRKVLLEFFSLHLYLFFSQNVEILHSHFFCMNNQYFYQTFFLTKNTVEIYLIYWNLFLWIFSGCLDFDRNPTEKLHITNQYCWYY